MDAPFLPRQSMENVMSPLGTAHRGPRLLFVSNLCYQVDHRVTLVWILTDPELRHLPEWRPRAVSTNKQTNFCCGSCARGPKTDDHWIR